MRNMDFSNFPGVRTACSSGNFVYVWIYQFCDLGLVNSSLLLNLQNGKISNVLKGQWARGGDLFRSVLILRYCSFRKH